MSLLVEVLSKLVRVTHDMTHQFIVLFVVELGAGTQPTD